jgi:hypothetical protein
VGDDQLTPMLAEIYPRLKNDDAQIREFYWTIRVMDGEQVLKLRSDIRREVGMDRLR